MSQYDFNNLFLGDINIEIYLRQRILPLQVFEQHWHHCRNHH